MCVCIYIFVLPDCEGLKAEIITYYFMYLTPSSVKSNIHQNTLFLLPNAVLAIR